MPDNPQDVEYLAELDYWGDVQCASEATGSFEKPVPWDDLPTDVREQYREDARKQLGNALK